MGRVPTSPTSDVEHVERVLRFEEVNMNTEMATHDRAHLVRSSAMIMACEENPSKQIVLF